MSSLGTGEVLKPPETARVPLGQVAVAVPNSPWTPGICAVALPVLIFPVGGRLAASAAGANARQSAPSTISPLREVPFTIARSLSDRGLPALLFSLGAAALPLQA